MIGCVYLLESVVNFSYGILACSCGLIFVIYYRYSYLAIGVDLSFEALVKKDVDDYFTSINK